MSNTKKYTVAILGATGAVGQKILTTLENRDFPIKQLKLLSSPRSAGKEIKYKDQTIIVEEANPESFNDVEIAFFSAGGSISKQLAPEAVKRGAVVVDNTSAFRMDADVPLVVPEVNEAELKNHQGVIANPNCSTIQMVVALKPIQEKYGLERVIVSTYQSVSGSGAQAVEELREQSQAYLNGEELKPELLPVKSEPNHYPIAFNALPQIDVFEENGYTFEEMKMINETKKILNKAELSVAATCVRLPFFTSHAESIYLEVEKEASVQDIKASLKQAPGIVLKDNPEMQEYPTPLDAAGKPDVFVGRIRKDLDNKLGFHMWVVADNLLKGAALNSVQIAESMVKNQWL